MRRLAVLASLLLLGCDPPALLPYAPVPDQGRQAVATHGAIASASPYASEAGLAILRQGGNAVDAAVAAAFAVGVVEPQMSGVGGGGVALLWLQREGRAEYVDFYSSQPADAFRRAAARAAALATDSAAGAAARAAALATDSAAGAAARAAARPVDSSGGAAPPEDARQDLRTVGIPGNVAGLLALHARHGSLPRETVLAPAIRLAEEGYVVTQVLAGFITDDSAKLHRDPAAAAFFWPEGQPLRAGAGIRNPELAAVLRRIADQGADGFYRGPTAELVLAALNAGGHPAGTSEFASFPVLWKRPLCAVYRGHVILSAPPPQTGNQVLEALQLLERQTVSELGLPTRSGSSFHLLAGALRTAGADHRANDDPRWRPVPARGLVSEPFAVARATAPSEEAARGRYTPESAAAVDDVAPEAACLPLDPYASEAPAVPDTGGAADWPPPAAAPVQPGDGETTHISVVDAAGNAVALTQTNSSTFGIGRMVSGFILNDSGYRFAAAGPAEGGPAWRTRVSTIAPTIVLRDGRARIVIGAPGAGRIPPAITQVLSYLIDHGLPPLEAVRMPRLFTFPDSTTVELEHGFPAVTLSDVVARGYRPVPARGYARVYLVARQAGRWVAVADPRHDGAAAGY